MIIPGILILSKKTYGKKKDKFLYRCRLNDNRTVLVPYSKDYKKFSKKFNNLYILVKVDDHTEENDMCTIHDIIGNVDDLNNFGQYLMHCNNCIHSISKFKRIVSKLAVDTPDTTDPQQVYTIDPKGCKDFDDAVSIKDDIITVYITNVAAYLDKMDLWDNLSDRISTVYFPDYNYPMLPKKLSEDMFSLKAGNRSLVLAFELRETGINFYTTCISVTENLEYDNAGDIGEKLVKITKTTDTHEAIAHLMIKVNNYCAKQNGLIYRNCTGTPFDATVPFEDWPTAEYSLVNSGHQLLGLDNYAHITSPIRRMVDIINSIKIQKLSIRADDFYNKWITRVDYINDQSKKIKKIQNKTLLLKMCTENNDTIYEGQIVQNSNTVYIKELSMFTKIEEDLDLGTVHSFKIYTFLDESSFNRKVRIKRLIT
jgi:exoribonuclease R